MRAADILQPDLAICGGITEAMRISALAARPHLRLAPHLWGGAGVRRRPARGGGAGRGYILEYSLGANPMLHDLVEGFPVHGGMVEIPSRPGLGITIRADFVERYRMR